MHFWLCLSACLLAYCLPLSPSRGSGSSSQCTPRKDCSSNVFRLEADEEMQRKKKASLDKQFQSLMSDKPSHQHQHTPYPSSSSSSSNWRKHYRGRNIPSTDLVCITVVCIYMYVHVCTCICRSVCVFNQLITDIIYIEFESARSINPHNHQNCISLAYQSFLTAIMVACSCFTTTSSCWVIYLHCLLFFVG